METRRKRQETIIDEEKLTVTSSIHLAKDSATYKDKQTQKTLSVRRFLVEPSYIRVNCGCTRNQGNFESLRLDIAITTPCYTEEIDDMIPIISDKVAFFLEAEISKYTDDK